MNEEKKTFYEILGVKEIADLKEIASSYRIASLKHHPDKNPGNPSSIEIFHSISEAYRILSDEKTRKSYDLLLTSKRQREERELRMNKERIFMMNSLIEREREFKRQKRAEEEAEKNINEILKEMRKKEATENFSNRDERTLKFRCTTLEQIDEVQLMERFPGIESIIFNRNKTQGEILFFTRDDAELAYIPSSKNIIFEKLKKDEYRAPKFERKRAVNFDTYEQLTLEKLKNAAIASREKHFQTQG